MFISKNNFGDVFYIFNLNKNSISQFQSILDFFLSDKTNLGLIIIVDKNSFSLKEMNFLKVVLLNFYFKNKKLGIWGLPYCIWLKILGDFDYTRFYDYLVKENNSYFENFNINSSLSLKCKKCINVESCFGLGNLDINLSNVSYRLSPNYFKDVKNYVKFENLVEKLHSLFLNHILENSGLKTERTITYARVFKKNKVFDYKNRFIYFCNFLDLKELNIEKNLLLNYSKNSVFINNFFVDYPYFFRRFAYSLAFGEKTRESIYGFFQDENKSNLYLDKLSLDFSKENFENFVHSIGYDLVEGKISGYKLYSYINSDSDFFNYLKEKYNLFFSEKFIALTYKYLWARRFDENGILISIKVEVYTKDYSEFKKVIFDNYNIKLNEIENLDSTIFAFDFDLLGNLNKITTYYWYL